jgi:FkbM family methyltransferase
MKPMVHHTSRTLWSDRVNFFENTIRWLTSRPITQPAYFQLAKLCDAGMNYGGGHSVLGSGEMEALSYLHKLFGRGKALTLFDVGANDGEYLEASLHVFGNQVTAWSFEPQSTSFDRLRGRFAEDSRVNLRKTAVGSESGTADLFYRFEGETTASLGREHIYWQSSPDQLRSETVNVSTIDQICMEEYITQIDLLKIDTEGHEFEVLLGASGMVRAGAIFAVQFEFGETLLGTRYHFKDFWDLLSPHYRFHRILRHGLVEISRYSPDLEIYKMSNFLCLSTPDL